MAETERLEAIRQRVRITTPGPWTPMAGNNDGIVRAHLPWGGQVVADCHGCESNAEFLAHCREDVPWLLAQLADAHAQCAAAEQRAAVAVALADETFKHLACAVPIGAASPTGRSWLETVEDLRHRLRACKQAAPPAAPPAGEG
jgi:hypothetical protein